MDKERNSSELRTAATTQGIPVAPSLGPTLSQGKVRHARPLVDKRLLIICALSAAVAGITAIIALFLVQLINLITNLSFYGRFSAGSIGPAGNQLGPWVILVPTVGGVIVGIMARYGSKAIRGHGIPEAMEQVLSNDSIIPARLTFLKPISAAISIGTGGPFGAEGPIIASGGALGSLVGQLLQTTAHERKTLLAAGAAAGMTAIFGSPVASILLVIELLIFEYRPRSFVPIAVAATCAGALRLVLFGPSPAFELHALSAPTLGAMVAYLVEGLLVGGVSVFVTKLVYWIEDEFERLPIHWMWWPALGGIVVGIVGYFSPHTMGVGYDNIDRILSGTFPLKVAAVFCFMKLVSWSISLGTGTSGGTLAPLFTIGGGVGLLYGGALQQFFPNLTLDISVAALVGMAAIFSGASRAMMASIVFCFETTHQPWAILPLIAGCTAAYIISCLRMENTIMTEKIARRGINVPAEYDTDPLTQIHVGELATKNISAFLDSEAITSARARILSNHPDFTHQGYPVTDRDGKPVGVITRKDILGIEENSKKTLGEALTRSPVVVAGAMALSDARDIMADQDIGRLLVVDGSGKLVGLLTRSDVIRAYHRRLHAESKKEATFRPKRDEA